MDNEHEALWLLLTHKALPLLWFWPQRVIFVVDMTTKHCLCCPWVQFVAIFVIWTTMHALRCQNNRKTSPLLSILPQRVTFVVQCTNPKDQCIAFLVHHTSKRVAFIVNSSITRHDHCPNDCNASHLLCILPQSVGFVVRMIRTHCNLCDLDRKTLSFLVHGSLMHRIRCQ